MRSTSRIRRASSRFAMQSPRLRSISTVEQLEDRVLLAADLYVSLYDPTNGLSVQRFDSNYDLVGGVTSGSGGLQAAQGIAVAPDGTLFVTSMANSKVLHFSADGAYLGALGEADATKATFFVPGSLQFGPNGNLYVADVIGGNIQQFDIDNVGQQFVVGGTLNSGFGTGGFTWDADGNIIVGSVLLESVTRFDSEGNPTTLIEPGSNIVPTAILVRPDGDLLIADINFGGEPEQHHQIVRYDMSEDTVSQFINLTFPVGTEPNAGDPPQPSSLIYDEDGQLLIGVSPDHNFNGAIQRFDATTGEYIETLVSGTGTPTGLARAPVDETTEVVGRQIFYNQSKFDGNQAAANSLDDGAIAPDKVPYFVGDGLAGPIHATGFASGINGIMVDVANPGGTLTASDFTFKIGSTNTPADWAAAPAPSQVVVRPGAGIDGSDRVEIVWANGAIKNTWLQITVEGNDEAGGFNTNTGLAASDVFFFGNRVADTFLGTPDSVFTTNANDEIGARQNTGFGVAITNIYDFHKDGVVNANDSIAARTNIGFTPRINIVASPPQSQPQIAQEQAPQDNGPSSGIASALALLAAKPAATDSGASDVRLTVLETTRIARSEAVAAILDGEALQLSVSAAAEASDVDDELIDALVARLG